MKKNNSNYIRLTILKIKQCSEQNLSSYSLKIDFCKQTNETDKLSAKELDLGKVIYLNSEFFLRTARGC
jgi:hypothetical protein